MIGGSAGDIIEYLSNLSEQGRYTETLMEVRGQTYTPAIAGAASTGTSYSSAIGSKSSGGNVFSNGASSVASTSGIDMSLYKDVSSIYAELFENQQHPIRVSLAKLEAEAKDDFGIGYDGMKVDIQNNDVNTLIQAVYSVRGNQ